MKREAKILLGKSIDSLTLAVEIFNRPQDRGRATATLIFLDHSFEMLLKALLLHRGGRIREPRARETIGFDACVRVAFSNGSLRFLSEGQALTLQSINGLRDAAQHHILDISEGQLYIQAQAGLTLFKDLMSEVLGRDLGLDLPKRVLPLATAVPTDLEILFSNEISEIKKLLQPGTRRQTEAMARLLPLAILDSALRGEKGQPSSQELSAVKKAVVSGKPLEEIFEGVAAVQLAVEGNGPSIQLRLTKKEGIPTHLVPEGTEGASTVAVKRVNELDYYSLGLTQLATKIELSQPRALAVILRLRIQEDPEFFKIIKIGRTVHKRYSKNALTRIRGELPNLDLDAVWREHRPASKRAG